MLTTFAIVVRLLLAVLMGGAIGLERERSNQPAGFRTHIILCVGSTLMMMISIFMVQEYSSPDFKIDPTRIAAQVVSGIGFLGAGAILRIGGSIKGLTTAASLWTTGGIGLAIGCGFYTGSFIAVGIIVVSLSFLGKIDKLFFSNGTTKNLSITTRDMNGILSNFDIIMNELGVKIKNIHINRSFVKGIVEINSVIEIPADLPVNRLIDRITKVSDVFEVEIM